MTQLWRAFSHTIPLFLLIIPLAVLLGYILYRRRRMHPIAAITAAVDVFLILSVIGILLVTLLPRLYTLGQPSHLQIVPFVSSYQVLTNSVDASVPIRILGFNILLFVPFGFFLAWRLSSPHVIKKTVTAAMGFSLFIEISQFLLPLGRTANIDDVILNTTGALLGACCWIIVKRFIPARQFPQT